MICLFLNIITLKLTLNINIGDKLRIQVYSNILLFDIE